MQLFILLSNSGLMFAFAQRIFERNMSNNNGVALNEQRKEGNGQEVENSSQLNSSVNAGVLHLDRVSSLDILEQGYCKVRRSVEDPRFYPYDRNESCNKTLEDLLCSSLKHGQEIGKTEPGINGKIFPVGSIEEEKEFEVQQKRDFMSPMAKKRDSFGDMLQIARNNAPGGDITEILKERAKIYGNNLDPN